MSKPHTDPNSQHKSSHTPSDVDWESPVTDEIRQLGIERIYGKNMTCFVDNCRPQPIICIDTGELKTTSNALEQALIDTGEFDDRAVTKILFFFADAWRERKVKEEYTVEEEGSGNSDAGTNNNNNNKQKTPSAYDLDQVELQLVQEKLTAEDIDFVIRTLTKKAPHDVIPIKQLLYGMSSVFTKNPIPHVVNSRDAGSGKNYLLSLIATHFPRKYVLPLTGMSDKAIYHRPGEMVIEEYNDETGEIEVKPIDPILNELQVKLEEIYAKRDKTREDRLEYKDIESQMEVIKKRSEKLIDLDCQIIVGLDTVQDGLIDALMALISQDFPGDQKYEFAEKSSSGKMGRRVNRLRGVPGLFMSRVIDDTRSLRFAEKNRRFISISPVTTGEKIHTANCHIGLSYGSLPEEYDELVPRQDNEKCDRIILTMIAKLKQHGAYLGPKEASVLIPFKKAISECIPYAENQVWSMTVTDRTFKYLSIITKVNMDDRPRMVNVETGQFWPISIFKDLKEALILMETAASGVRPYIANWYNRVFLPAFRALDGKPNELRGNNNAVITREKYVGVTTEQLAEKTKQVYGGKKPSSGELRDKYLYPLENQGVIDKVVSKIDQRQRLFFPVETTAGESNIFSLFQNSDDIRLRVPTLDVYPTKNRIEEYTRSWLEYEAKGGVRKYKLLDVDGKEISPSELVEKYFSSPEDCFIEDDETLRVENKS